MTINIHATGIELTPALRQYAEDKIGGLTKFFDGILSIDIDVGARTHHHQKGEIYYAEANMRIPGRVVRVVKEEADVYKAIDKLKDHLKVDLEKAKEKLRRQNKEELRNAKAYEPEL